MRLSTSARARAELVERLRSRRSEIEQETLTRVFGIAGDVAHGDAEYMLGLRSTVAVALELGLSALEEETGQLPVIPTALLDQARRAAQSGVSLDTVLRRYFAGYTLLGDFIVQEVQSAGIAGGSELHRLLRSQAAIFDQIVVAVTKEHGRTEQGRLRSSGQKLNERVEKLLAGQFVEVADLDYELGEMHLGLIAAGPEAQEAIRAVAATSEARLLLVKREDEIAWGWLGSRQPLELGDTATDTAPRAVLAVGEPARGISGWRLTHRQARAVMPIALQAPERLTRYSDAALRVAMLRDDLLVASLREMFLAPLACDREEGAVAKETLRAYFATDRNISSAAAVLGVSRQAVGRRLRAVEDRLGRSLRTCAAELEAALHLEEDAPVLSLSRDTVAVPDRLSH